MLTFLRNESTIQTVAMKRSLFIVFAFAVPALALLLGGCSTVSLVYRNADWYLQHKIDGYTSFNAQQKELIRRDVTAYMQWHRKNALPEYVIFLQNLNGTVQYDGQLKAGDIALLRAHLLDLYQRSLAPAVRPSAELLNMLDSRQLLELGSNLAEENQQQLKEQFEISRDAYLNRRADKTVNFLEWLAGDLSAEQEQKVREMSRQLPVVSAIYIRHRQENQSRLIALLNSHAGAEKISAFLTAWIFNPEQTRSPQQQHAIESFEAASDEMIARIHGMLTAKQKGHIHKRISSYIDAMRAEIDKARQDSGK
jgi:hypothetical protein